MNKVFNPNGGKSKKKKTGGKGKKIFGGGRLQAASRPTGGAVPLNGKTACFIWCHWGDAGVTALGQDTVRLKKAMDGYDHKVLMKTNNTPSWLDFSEADERKADVKMTPNRTNFTRELVRLAQEGYIIDVYVFAHGDRTGFTAVGTGIDDALIRGLPAAAGLRALPIRMVYQTQCYASFLNNDWRAAGAKSSVGARYIQFTPTHFGTFIKDWNKNDRFGTAASQRPSAALRTASQVYIMGDAKAKKIAGKWDGCSFGNTVLGKKACAKAYFTYRWLRDSEWRDDMSGKQNMNYSSAMVVSGNRNLSKATRNLRW